MKIRHVNSVTAGRVAHPFNGVSVQIEMLAFKHQKIAKEVNRLFFIIISYRFPYYWNDSGKKALEGLKETSEG